MKAIATDKGYFGQVREAGDEFEVPDDTKPSTWFKLVDEQKPAGKHEKHGKHGSKADPDSDPI